MFPSLTTAERGYLRTRWHQLLKAICGLPPRSAIRAQKENKNA